MLDVVKLTKLMEIHGINKTQLADIMGVSSSMCLWLLKGKRDMKVRWLQILATHFNLTMDELWKNEAI